MCAIRRQNKRNSGLSRTGRPAAGAKVGVASGAFGPRGLSGPAGGANFCDFESIFVDFETSFGIQITVPKQGLNDSIT